MTDEAAVQDKLFGGLSLKCDYCGVIDTVASLAKLEAHKAFRKARWDIETEKSGESGDEGRRIIVTKAVCEKCTDKIIELRQKRNKLIDANNAAYKEALAAIKNPKPEELPE